MTHREAFETAKAHLLKQNAKALLDLDKVVPACAYRTPDGKKCAIGCLIPDSEYKPEFETKNAAYLVGKYGKDLPSLQGLDSDFLLVLQKVHDNYEPEDWARELDFFEQFLWHLLAA